MTIQLVKIAAFPLSLIAALFSPYAASYELLLNFTLCLGALIAVQHEVRLKEYFWAAGFVGIAVVFSPLVLAAKIFVLMGFACTVTFVTMLAAFRTQAVIVQRRRSI